MTIFMIFLLCASIEDLKSRKIGIWIYILAFAAGVLLFQREEREIFSVLMAMIPGSCLLFLSWFTEGTVGEGDGLFLIVAGLYLVWQEVLLLLTSGIFLSGILGVFMLAAGRMRKKNLGNMVLPFLPFLIPGSCYLLFSRG